MDQPAPEAARTAAYLARNAVDCLPAGALAERLAEPGRPLRVKLGIDPTAPDIHLGHTVVLQKLREFQDAGHTRGADHRRLHRARGRPVAGARATRPVLSRGGDRRATRAPTRSRRPKVLARPTSGSRCAATASGSTCRWRSCFRLVRTVTVAQLLERDDFAKRCAAREPISHARAALPACCRATTRWRCAPTSSSAAPTRSSTCCWAATIQRAYGQPQQVVLTMPLLVGHRRRAARCPSRSATTIGVTDPPEEMYGKMLRIPDEAMATWYYAAARRGAAAGRASAPRDAKRALARALVARFHGEDAAAAAEARVRPRVRRARAAGGDRGGRSSRPTNGDRAPAGADRRGVRRLALGGAAACSPRAA